MADKIGELNGKHYSLGWRGTNVSFTKSLLAPSPEIFICFCFKDERCVEDIHHTWWILM